MLKNHLIKIIIIIIIVIACIVLLKYIKSCIENVAIQQANKLKLLIEEEASSFNIIKKIFSLGDYLGKKKKK